MIVKNTGLHSQKPKNYTRNGNVCSCLCLIIIRYPKIDFLDTVTVKYSLEPNKNIYTKSIKSKKAVWFNYQYWATFKEVLELPKIFEQLDENDYIIKTAHFTRDCVQVPFVSEIEIVNVKKYQSIKLKDNRKNKLNKILNI